MALFVRFDDFLSLGDDFLSLPFFVRIRTIAEEARQTNPGSCHVLWFLYPETTEKKTIYLNIIFQKNIYSDIILYTLKKKKIYRILVYTVTTLTQNSNLKK